MTIKAGEEVRWTGDFRCRRCGEVVHVEGGLTLPVCPVCKGSEFSIRERPLESV
jgi:Zn finger protein HypA/HybF involved in hydrogenase expression